MPAPINYTQGFIDPTQSLMQTLQMGNMLSQMGAARDQRVAAKESAEAQAARAAEIKTAYDTALANPTAENFQKLASYYPPEQQDAIRKGYTMLDEAAQKRLLNDSMDVFIAFDSGQTDIAISRMEAKAEAYKNAGNEQAAKEMQTLIDLAKTGEKGAQGVAGMFGANISLMNKEAMEGYAKYKEEQRAAAAEPDVIKKRLADLGYTEAQTNKFLAETRKLDAETAKLALELEEKKKSGGLEPKEKIDKEMQLNNTVNSRLTASREAQTSYENIKAGAAASDGVGDLAIVNTFMRLLSPGIVTGEDYEAATKSGGLLDELKTLKAQVAKGELLSPGQRERFVSLSKTFMENAKKQNEEQLTGVRAIVKSYGLNEENVFGSKTKEAAEPVAVAAPASNVDDVAALKAFIVSRFPNEAAQINSLDLAGLQAEYPKSVASYKPAGAQAAAPVQQTVVEADF